MKWEDQIEETYYAVGEPEKDLLGIADEPCAEYPIGVAVGIGTLVSTRGELPLFYLVVDGRELPGTWTLQGRELTRGEVRGHANDRASGYPWIRQLIA